MQTGGIRLIICTTLAAVTTGSVTPAHAYAQRPVTVQTLGAAHDTAHGATDSAPRKGGKAAPTVAARAAYLFDATTGASLLGKQATKRMPVASLTKVMTAYVVLREAKLDDVVQINAADVRHAATNDATGASLRAGERLTVRDLLHGVMLPSGADASHALARVYGPGDAKFVAKMNTAARSLGLAGTRYANPDGLPKPSGGYSTAQDQAKLAQTALGDPVLLGIASTRRYVVPASKTHRAHTWTNTNKLLGKAPGALGVKTGYTRAAGYCLSFAADRDGHRLIGVILGDSKPDRRFQTATRLLDWGSEQESGGDQSSGDGNDTGNFSDDS
ncbi:serine hydrolase [Streptosporangium sp. NPDC051023]|uniref:D-alanyl-D-alanine carboxypeptidase family protein n=1 Tax=Streptosporangium sp. NPDC051023 TaxID=3155410 RepID=UPI00344F3FCD